MTQDPSAPVIGGIGRRAVGLLIDWFLSLLISSAFFPLAFDDDGGVLIPFLSGRPEATLAIWALQHLVLVATLGTTIGHRIMRLKVVRADGAPFVGVPRALGRTLLIALVIPALLTDREGVALHDSLMGTVLIRSDVMVGPRADAGGQ